MARVVEIRSRRSPAVEEDDQGLAWLAALEQASELEAVLGEGDLLVECLCHDICVSRTMKRNKLTEKQNSALSGL